MPEPGLLHFFLHSAQSFARGDAHYQNFTNESKRRQREKKKEKANVDVVVVQWYSGTIGAH